MIATYEGRSFPALLSKAEDSWDLLILVSETDLSDPALKRRLGAPRFVCGGHPAYIPEWVSGEQREGAETYLEFIATHCDARS